MSREIKFRAYSTVTGTFDHLSLEDAVMFNPQKISRKSLREDLTFQQCTGLKDKNDVEIYEGDICTNVSGRMAKCVYHNDSASFDFEALSSAGCPHGYTPQSWKYGLAVIGNIHQNPELLNDK